jgi:rRNA-processing protein FCF1
VNEPVPATDELRPVLSLAANLAVAARRGAVDGVLPPAGLRQSVARGRFDEARDVLARSPEYCAVVARRVNPEVIGDVGVRWLADPTPAPISTADVSHEEPGSTEAVDVASLEIEVADLRMQRGALRHEVSALAEELDVVRSDRDELSRAVDEALDEMRIARDRAAAARRERAAALAERDRLAGLLAETERMRDRALAERAQALDDRSRLQAELDRVRPRPPAGGPGDRVDDASPRSGRRTPLSMPGGVSSRSVQGVRYLVEHPGILLVVDGYNVAMAGWPGADLAAQRDRLLDALDAVVSRCGVDVLVVFDGSDVPGGLGARRLARSEFSPEGVTADDIIRRRVDDTAARRHIVAATADRELAASLRDRGVNVVPVAPFLEYIRK